MSNSWLAIRFPLLPIAIRLKKRVPWILLTLLLVILLAMVISVGYGEYPIPPLAVVKTIFNLPTGNNDYDFIVNTLRLPRTVVACFVGMALAIAGTIIQGITRNPLAAPGIIGVNAGASLAAVSLIVLVPNAPVEVLPFAAFAGALLVAALIYLLAWDGGSSPIRLILVGVGLNLIVGALTNLMTTFGNINRVSQALVWLTGSVYGRSWEEVTALLPWLIIFSVIALFLARDLNVMNLGDDLAKGVGTPLEWRRGILLITSVALAGSAVATAGSIQFVGLMAPHLSRFLVGQSHEGLVLTSALMGGMLVVVADLVGRMLFAPLELPCGLVTATIGAPFFIFLLIRRG